MNLSRVVRLEGGKRRGERREEMGDGRVESGNYSPRPSRLKGPMINV